MDELVTTEILKVVVVHSKTTPSGLTQIVKGICSGLKLQRVEIILVLLSKSPAINEDDFFIAKGLKIVYLNQGSIFFRIHKLKQLIQAFTPHLLHTHGFQGIFFCSFLIGNLPHVSTVHGNLFISYRDDFNWFFGSFLAFAHLALFRLVSHPVLVSASLMQLNLVPKNAKVILNGVDKQSFFSFSETERLAVRKKLNLLPNKFIFISIGRVIKLKQPALLINSFSKLSLLYPNLELHFIGDGNLLPSLQEEFRNLPNVFFHGKQSNVVEWLNASDCFLSASVSEGFPNAPLEAYSCGTPMILSAIGPHLEIGEQIPNDVMFFNSQEEVEGLMKKAIDNKYRIANTNAFSQEEMADNYLQLYLEIANEKNN